jgi:pilus assembly protein Flp/PilA
MRETLDFGHGSFVPSDTFGETSGDAKRKRWIRMISLAEAIARVLDRDDGQGLAEYALILALIAIVAIVALIFLGTQVSGILSTVGSSV